MRQDKADWVTRLQSQVGGDQVDLMLVGPWLVLRARGQVQAAAWSVCSRTSPESPCQVPPTFHFSAAGLEDVLWVSNCIKEI